MLKKLIRRKYFCVMLAQLRGAKKLRERENPNFVFNTVCDLCEVPLGLEQSNFPKILVGSHADNAELILRQNFLLNILL